MSVVGLLLVAATGILYALLDLSRKALAQRLALVPLLVWMTAGAVPLYAAWALVTVDRLPGQDYLLPGLGSTALNVVANLCFLRAVQVGSLGKTIPLLSLTPVLATVAAVPLLGEIPSPRQWIGIGMVVTGALVLGLIGAYGPRSASDREGMAWMIVVAVLWSVTLPVDKLALRYSAPAIHGLVLHAGIAGCLLVVLWRRRRLSELRQARSAGWLLAATVVCGAAALAAQLLALERVLAGFVETFKRCLGSVAALGFGAALLGERIGTGQATAVAIMAGGVAVLLL